MADETEVPARRATDVPTDAPWWARMLVTGWQDCWKWASSWLTAIAAAAPMIYEGMPQIQSAMSPQAFHMVESVLVLMIFVGRMKRQEPKP